MYSLYIGLIIYSILYNRGEYKWMYLTVFYKTYKSDLLNSLVDDNSLDSVKSKFFLSY